MSHYIGKTISLISNKGLRYVGLLDNINADDATVALKSVRLLGTEGRMAQNGTPSLEVLPGTDVYDYVVFRGSDVKDLSVLDIPIDQVKPQPVQPYYQATQPQQPAQPQQQPAQPQQAQTPAQAQAQAQPQPQSRPAPETPKEIPAPAKESQPEPAERRPRNERKPNNGQKVAIPDTEFDFETANAKFSKDLESEREADQASYNKSSSFFDTISSSTEERNTMRWSEEKNLNLDTFGESSIQRGGRGRGRGWRGRGNWRGRGRGGRGRGNSRNDDYNNKPEWA